MSEFTDAYLNKVKGLGIRGIPFMQLARAYDTSKDNPKKRKVIREKLINDYLSFVGDIAERMSAETNVDLDELIGEGNISLCACFSRDRSLRTLSKLGIQQTIERGLKRLVLNQILDNLKKERSVQSLSTEPPSSDFLNLDFPTIDAKIRSILTEKEYTVFNQRSFLYTPWPVDLSEIGRNLKKPLSRERVRQIYNHAERTVLKTLEEISDILVEYAKRNPKLRWKLYPPEYSPHIVEALDHELQKKQGIGLSQLAEALDLMPSGLAGFVGKACNIKLNKSEKKELFITYGGRDVSAERRIQTLELYRKVTSYLGALPEDFMAYFNMSEENFADFIIKRFPDLNYKELRKVISLSGEERKELKEEIPMEHEKTSEFELLERVLYLLENDSYARNFPHFFATVTEKLKHALFPFYINDTERCLKLIDRKIAEYKKTEAKKYLKEVYDFFKKASIMRFGRIKTPLDEFQKVDVLTMNNTGRHILASETGVGKSLEMIATAESLPVNRVLILTCKTSALSTWKKEITNHLGDEVVVITGDDLDKNSLFERARSSKWVVSTYEIHRIFPERFRELYPDMIVIDEADVMNNPSSCRTKAICSTSAKYKFCVSGWIFRNKREELWPILNWMYPEEYPFRDQFVKKYCKDEWGRAKLKYDLASKLIYRPKSLVLPGLPSLEITTIPVSMTQEQTNKYKKAEKKFIDWYQKHYNKSVPSGITMAKLHRLRRVALKPKFNLLYGMLRERHKEPNKTVIFCTYIEEAMRIATAMSKVAEVGYFDGSTYASERDETITKFNHEPRPEILVMTEAGGKSIELISADYLYLFNPVWTHSLRKQIIDRLHRRGQKRNVYVHEFITEGTLEENMIERTEQKKEEYEKTVIDTFGYSAWLEEGEENIISLVLKDIVSGKKQKEYKKLDSIQTEEFKREV